MSEEKRKVSTDALETLGTIITDGGRDAIHLAVEPVIAGEELIPGANIGLKNGYAYSTTDKALNHVDKHLGIVDPFLKESVKPGEKFWLIVYPRQITSLRHVWSHPDFEESIPLDFSKEASKKWMMEWAKEHMSNDYYGYNEKIYDEQAFANAIIAGREHHLGRYESAGEHIDNTWWNHWENITGERGDRDDYFSCSC